MNKSRITYSPSLLMMQFVAASQPFNAIHYFGFAAYSMPSYWLPLLRMALQAYGSNRWLSKDFEISSRTGPWRLLMSDTEKDGA
ncbi:hypothetical protein SASPL_108795 [Salvia splendens]|uniref:Uncharacterized protein n=1 Tax=Salvia splendens TaxID=180675 RepID=A0A8X9A6Y9_SALSN|nr:hypothetical protein SASPL_108795 [Salvia splendens]